VSQWESEWRKREDRFLELGPGAKMLAYRFAYYLRPIVLYIPGDKIMQIGVTLY
jgi:hypothetical protein